MMRVLGSCVGLGGGSWRYWSWVFCGFMLENNDFGDRVMRVLVV